MDFSNEGAAVQPPLEVLGDGGAQELGGLHNVHLGAMQENWARMGLEFF